MANNYICPTGEPKEFTIELKIHVDRVGMPKCLGTTNGLERMYETLNKGGYVDELIKKYLVKSLTQSEKIIENDVFDYFAISITPKVK